MLLQYVSFKGCLGSTFELTTRFRAFHLHIFIVNFHVRVQIMLKLAGIITKVTFKRFIINVLVSNMTGEGAGSWAGHITMGALVVVDVRSHVVSQQSFKSKLFTTIVAGERILTGHLLSLAVIKKLDSVGEESSAIRTSDHFLLRMRSQVFF